MTYANTLQKNMMGMMCGMCMCGMTFGMEKLRMQKTLYGLCK